LVALPPPNQTLSTCASSHPSRYHGLTPPPPSARARQAPKDPGIPAAWPFKDELMKEIDFEVEKKKATEEAKASEKAERRSDNRKRARDAMSAGLPPP